MSAFPTGSLPLSTPVSSLQSRWQPILTRITECSRGTGGTNNRFGHAYIDLNLSCRPCDVTCLVFQNNYTASMTLEQRPVSISTLIDCEPRTLLQSYSLMEDPECEDDAEAWHAIYNSQFERPLVVLPKGSEPAQVALRIHLQSAPNFQEASLQNFKAFKLAAKVETEPLVDSLSSASTLVAQADQRLSQLRHHAARSRLPRQETTVRRVKLGADE
eukprot:TRINITY_DN86737_c0_g1_i1.p1 TRINITY_DN86737_c0_g1~~TRINITY_DN86737_c0_g1_i1.p1  ORF type:complete len:216 (+),score=36.05 TRINITY_DN86737_c0_g1_i1:39-686(+)